MAKYLKDVLKGKKESTKKVNDLGGYKPKAGDEAEFAKKHEIEKHEDRVGNGDDVYNASNIKPVLNRPEEKRHKDAGKVYESKKAEDIKCNMTEAGTYCPMHEMANCSSMRKIDEISNKLALNYAKGASKSMDTASEKGSAGYETFMKRSAGQKLALDKTNPEHKRLKAKVGTTDANSKDAAYKKSIGEEAQQVDELSTDTYHSAAQKAAKRAMGDAMGRSGPIFKKYAGMANKFRAKGMEQEKQEKAAKSVKEDVLPGTFVEPSAAAKNKAKKVQQKDADNAVVSRAKMGMTTEERMPHQMDAGELRQHLATHYGHIEHGSYVSPQKHRTYLYHVNRLAKMIGKSTEHVRKQVKKDHGMKDDMNEGAKIEEGIRPLKRTDTKFKDNPASFSNMPAKSYRLPGVKSKAEIDAEKNKALTTYTGKITKLKPGKAKGVKEANAVEPLLQDNDHSNEAAEMARTELKALANKALHLVMKMPESMHVEPWCQAKIAQAKSMINDVHDYMIYGEHDKEENESDTPMDITTASNPSNSFPNMSVDVGRNV